MPPKRKPQNDEDHSDEDRLDDPSDNDEEVWDPDYQEDHQTERKKKNTVFEEDGDEDAEPDGEDTAGNDEDGDDAAGLDVDYDIDTMEYQDDEVIGDEVEPPAPDIIKTRRVVPPGDRVTSDRMSAFETARVLGDRARHLENGARPNVDIKNCTSSLEIAYMELMEKRIPMAVIRKVGLGYVEIWRAKEMTIPKLPPIEYFMVQIK